jgi:hypothetical protein
MTLEKEAIFKLKVFMILTIEDTCGFNYLRSGKNAILIIKLTFFRDESKTSRLPPTDIYN